MYRFRGNQAVQRLFKTGAIQPKLRIGQPNDIYEQEADRVADEVMRMPEPIIQPKPTCPFTNNSSCGDEEPIQTKPLASRITPLVQRQRQPIEEEEEEILQTKESSTQSTPVRPDIETNIQSARTGGTPLPESTRAFFEPIFGRDFSRARIHTGPDAIQMNRTLNAQAFTYKKNIYLGEGLSNPGTLSNTKLLAHELVHVLQQQSEGDSEATTFIQRRCLSDEECEDGSLPGCRGPGRGSAEAFGEAAGMAERAAVGRRRGMSHERARASGHGGRALQLERLLEDYYPDFRTHIRGIFVSQNLHPSVWGEVGPCDSDLTMGIGGGDRLCIYVSGQINREAFVFNETDEPEVGDMSREEWRIRTLAALAHEIHHTQFPPTRPRSPDEEGCTPELLGTEGGELGAIMSEFTVYYRELARNPDPAFRARILDNYFMRAMTSCEESIPGTIRAMRCMEACTCDDVNEYVRYVFESIASFDGWTEDEFDAFNTELRDSRWSPWFSSHGWPL